QDTASNLFAGLVILLDRPFDVEDYIETPDVVGTVEEITFRSTRLRTVTNAQIVVPNNVLTSKPITNWSRLQKRRVAFTISLEFGTTSTQMNRCIQRITALLNDSPDIVEGSPVVNFDAFGPSSLNINIVYFTKEVALAPHLKIKEALNLQIMAIIEEEDCSLAYPTQTLHIQKNER
ncbi:MAG: mechanosensitive ion channel family protein, partial [Oscillospiraceae bacterium]|nr:mechanosensitive ion channel family protein [Oscillospiraceae bacterium]